MKPYGVFAIQEVCQLGKNYSPRCKLAALVCYAIRKWTKLSLSTNIVLMWVFMYKVPHPPTRPKDQSIVLNLVSFGSSMAA